MAPRFTYVLICEGCGRSHDLRDPGFTFDGWAAQMFRVTTPGGPHERPIESAVEGGDICPDCNAEGRTSLA